MKLTATVVLCATLVFAPTVINAHASNTGDLSHVFVRLKQTGDGWRLVPPLRRTHVPPDASGVDVSLRDMLPSAGIGVERKISCIPIGECMEEGGRRKTRKTFKTREAAIAEIATPDFGPFFDEKTNVGESLLNNAAGLFLTFGLATGINVKTYKFDMERYHAALDSATQRLLGEGASRADLGDLISYARNRYNELHETYQSQIQQYVETAAEFRPSIDIVTRNSSGLTLYYPGKPILSVEAEQVTVKGDAPSLVAVLSNLLFPEGKIRLTKEAIDNELTAFTDIIKNVRESSRQSRTFTFRCSGRPDLNLVYACPEKVLVTQRGQTLAVPVEVKSLRQSRLGFPEIATADRFIAVNVRPSGIEMANKTSQHIAISAISLYWGDKISTKANLDIVLPPKAKMERPYALVNFDHRHLLTGQPLIIRDADRGKLESMKMSAGVAVNYKLSDTPNSLTLYTRL